MTLIEFINSASSPKRIEYIASKSLRKDYARDVLNEILIESPEYKNTIYILSKLPILIWAEENRKSLKDFGLETGFTEVISIFIDETEGLTKPHKKVIRAIHLNKEDVSRFLMTSHYKEAVRTLCSRIHEKVNDVCCSYCEIYESYDASSQIACRDIEMLFYLNEDYLKGHETSGNLDSHTILVDAVNLLKTYPMGGDIIYACVLGNINGEYESKIASNIKKSRTFVRGRIKEGKIIISALLWGLMDKESMLWFKEDEHDIEKG